MKNKGFLILGAFILCLAVFLGGCQCNNFKFSMDSFLKSNSGSRSNGRDRKRPYIKLKGPEVYYIEQGNKFVEPGYYAKDNVDGDITKKVVISGEVNSNMLGIYILTYYVKDNAGNWARSKNRKVEVIKPRVKM
jgi:hypothetical protein